MSASFGRLAQTIDLISYSSSEQRAFIQRYWPMPRPSPRPFREIIHDAIDRAAAIVVAAEMRLDDEHDPLTGRQRQLWQVVHESGRALIECLHELRCLHGEEPPRYR